MISKCCFITRVLFYTSLAVSSNLGAATSDLIGDQNLLYSDESVYLWPEFYKWENLISKNCGSIERSSNAQAGCDNLIADLKAKTSKYHKFMLAEAYGTRSYSQSSESDLEIDNKNEREALEALLFKWPNETDAIFKLSLLEDSLEKRVKMYERIMALDENHLGAVTNLSKIYLDSNQPEIASKGLNILLNTYNYYTDVKKIVLVGLAAQYYEGLDSLNAREEALKFQTKVVSDLSLTQDEFLKKLSNSDRLRVACDTRLVERLEHYQSCMENLYAVERNIEEATNTVGDNEYRLLIDYTDFFMSVTGSTGLNESDRSRMVEINSESYVNYLKLRPDDSDMVSRYVNTDIPPSEKILLLVKILESKRSNSPLARYLLSNLFIESGEFEKARDQLLLGAQNQKSWGGYISEDEEKIKKFYLLELEKFDEIHRL